MSAKRFFDVGVPVGGWVALNRENQRHAHVSRLRAGEAVEIIDGRGNFWRGVYENEGVRVHQVGNALRSLPQLVLVVGLTQGTMEEIIRQAVEMGVCAIIPLRSRNSAPLGDEKRAGNKQGRWQKIIEEACKQSGNYFLPELHPIMGFAEALEEGRGYLGLVGALERRTVSWREVGFNQAEKIYVWVGPEGDFSSEEYDLLAASGAKLVGLGEYVLRTQTACVAILAAARAAARSL